MADNTALMEIENKEWLDSLEAVFKTEGCERVCELLRQLSARAMLYGVKPQQIRSTAYLNTIAVEDQPSYPGDIDMERRIKSINRWNAMAMVVRANRMLSGIGGHISTYASAATLYEVGFNHFFRAQSDSHPGDMIYFQGHAVPGIYARAFLEGRLSWENLENFRREFKPGGGLPSYPHPRLMPEFWQFPTVSMGLSPIMSIYQARFNRYLEHRNLQEKTDQKIWAFLGDGEMDEPESLGAISLAGRDKLDNLIWVVNCNLQRLDGPVRGNSKIIQELENVFSGAGWNVIKVVWGRDWDSLFENDQHGILARRVEELTDGQFQKYAASDGRYIREDFFGKDPRLAKLVEKLSDEQTVKLRRGGHDPVKVYAAYKAAVGNTGSPTVILAQTIKGYGLGEAGEGRNVTHQQKKLNEQELLEFRTRFAIPVPDSEVHEAPFYRPKQGSEELDYLHERRKALGGYLPKRIVKPEPIEAPEEEVFKEFFEGSGDREVATTMVTVRLLGKLLKDKNIGKHIVPIVPDEARTFGMESLFRQVGIYSQQGQLYEPVDKESLLYYNEQKNGAILEEGITEAGSMSSFIAAGTSYATHGLPMVPFYTFYSIFGWQRMLDLIWAASDAMARGFLFGGISGKTTLPGEGLQHCDGQSHHIAMMVPHLRAYDPTYAYELAVIVRDGIDRMYKKGENVFYYITMLNEFYHHPKMPEGAEEGILNGMYKLRQTQKQGDIKAVLMGSGAILNESVKAAELLENEFDIAADVWSVTSYKQIYTDAIETERENLLSGQDKDCYIERCLREAGDVFVSATDYVKALGLSIGKWVPGRYAVLGTDGFGRSEGRNELRDYFGVDSRHIAYAAIRELRREGKVDEELVEKAKDQLGIDPDKVNPLAI